MVVSRHPWATYALIGLCVAIFLLTHWSSASEESGRRFGEAVGYFAAHPETRPDERLLTPELALEARRQARPRLPTPSAANADEEPQAGLDRRTAAWIDSLTADPVWRWGLVPRERRAVTLVTHQFLHGGWLHLVGNVFLFFLVAPLVEDAIGGVKLGLLYLGLGAFSGLAYLAHYPDLFRPLLGASGAISAVLGIFVVLFARLKLRYLLWIGVPLGTFEAPAWVMLPVWFGFQVALGLEADSATAAGMGGVAYWAHAWGFAAGTGAGFLLRRRAARVEVAAPDALAEARRKLRLDDREAAWGLLLREVRSNPANEGAIAELWSLARQLGRSSEAAFAFARLVRQAARRRQAVRALEMWEELRNATRRAVDPAVSLAVVEALDREQLRRAERDALVAEAIEATDERTPTQIVVALAGLAASSKSSAIREAFAGLKRRVDLAARLERPRV